MRLAERAPSIRKAAPAPDGIQLFRGLCVQTKCALLFDDRALVVDRATTAVTWR
jgi:hypothetical protein